MKIIFGIFYLLFGVAWTFVAIRAGNVGIFAAGMAAVNFFASWGKFFGGGAAVRVVHVGLGSLMILIWVAAMIDLALHLSGQLHWVDTGGMMGYLEVFIGGMLVLPVIAYVVDFAGWISKRRRPGAEASPGTPNARAQSKIATDRPAAPLRSDAGRTWQRFHLAIGSTTLLIWASCWYFLVLNYFALVKSFGPFSRGVVEIVASILTIPAILYVVAYVQSRRPSRALSRSAPDAAKEAPDVEPAHGSGRIAVTSSSNRGIRLAGLALLAVLIAGVAFRASVGDDIMCHGDNAAACLAVAKKSVELKLWNQSPCRYADAWTYDETERICLQVAQQYVNRGDLEHALEIHDELWKRYGKALLTTRPDGVDRNWAARNELLIRLHASSRIDAAAEEVCGAGTYQRLYCESLIVALQRAKYADSMDKTSQLACASSPEPECRLYGNWLIDSGHKEAGLDVLRTACLGGQAHSCTSLGTALAAGRYSNDADARWALKRACELNSSTCSEYLRVEHQFVPDDEVRADARIVCRQYPDQCVAASRVIGAYLRDPIGARQILMQMCEQSPDLRQSPCNERPAPASVAKESPSLSLSPPPTQFKFSEGGNVSTQIVWRDGVLNLRSVGGFGPQQGKVLTDRRVIPTANAWKVLDAELRSLGVWSWPPVVDTDNRSADGVAWTFVVTTATRSFSSSGYNVYPAHYREVIAALQKLAEGASEAPALERNRP